MSLLTALALAQPCGDAEVVAVERFRDGSEGKYGYDTIYISQFSHNLEYVYHHECGHHIHSTHRLPTEFGKGPFITEYARTDRYEDFAEIYATWKMDPREAWRYARRDYKARDKLKYIIEVSKAFKY